MLSDRKPGATCISAQKLFAIRPAPISSTIAIAICATASPFRKRIACYRSRDCSALSDSAAFTRRVTEQRAQSEENPRRQRNHAVKISIRSVQP